MSPGGWGRLFLREAASSPPPAAAPPPPGGTRADRAVAEWKKLGVDNVRIFAQWGKIAPRTKPAGFNGADPATPGYLWTYLDDAVFRVRQAGMSVTLTI